MGCFFFKQEMAYERRISDWSSDVCSSDLIRLLEHGGLVHRDSCRRLSVGRPHYDRLASRASRALVRHQVTFRELLEATMALSLASIEQIGRASCRERVCQYV